MLKRILLLVIVVIPAILVPTVTAANVDTVAAEADTTEHKTFSYTFIPAIFYTPETGFAAGASVLLVFRGKERREDARPSTIAPALIFTEKSQVLAVTGYELNLKKELYLVTGGLGYIKFPDLFWGIGSDTPDSNEEKYTPESVFFSISLQKRVRPRVRVGLLYELGNGEITEKEEGGLLDSGTITGSDGGTVSGLGPVVSWDSRDNLFYATRGRFHTVSATFFEPGLGSDFTFQRYLVDLRSYFEFIRNVIAFQAVFSFITGDPPFQMMSQLGGANLMRGYYEGRYRDNHAIIVQAEWRRRVWWRLGVGVFVGAGDVAPKISEFRFGDFKPAAGAGFRFLIDRDEGISIRVDFGFIGGTPGPYITINEAF